MCMVHTLGRMLECLNVLVFSGLTRILKNILMIMVRYKDWTERNSKENLLKVQKTGKL